MVVMKHLVAGIILLVALCVLIIAIIVKPWANKNRVTGKQSVVTSVTPTITPTPTPGLLPCTYEATVSNHLREILPTYKVVPTTENAVRVTGVIWKHAKDQPFVRYTGSAGMNMVANDTTKFTDILNNGLKAYLAENGFKEDALNTYPDRSGHLTLTTLGAYAFTKNNELYIITYNSLGGGTINVTCARRDQQKDSTYSELLSMKPLPPEWNDIDDTTVLDIWEIHDSVVYLQVETLGGSSFGQYWYKDSYGWTKLYEGTALPACSIFEDKKAGHGIECIDCTDKTLDCIIRKTT